MFFHFQNPFPIQPTRGLTTTSNTCSITTMTTDDTQRTTLFLNKAILKQAKAEAILEEITLTQLVEKALIHYLPKETIIKKVKI